VGLALLKSIRKMPSASDPPGSTKFEVPVGGMSLNRTAYCPVAGS
jgi:hypothetical protein